VGYWDEMQPYWDSVKYEMVVIEGILRQWALLWVYNLKPRAGELDGISLDELKEKMGIYEARVGSQRIQDRD
jgi:hypothetical protein